MSTLHHSPECVSAPFCGCAQERIAELEAKRAEAKREHVALMNVSGALMDSGEVVPEDTCLYGEAVRKITARAEAAEAKLAEAQKAWRESRGPLTAALDRLKELEAKLAEAERERDHYRGAGELLVGAEERAQAAEAEAKALREDLGVERALRIAAESRIQGVEAVIHKWDNSTMTPDGMLWWSASSADFRAALAAGRKP